MRKEDLKKFFPLQTSEEWSDALSINNVTSVMKRGLPTYEDVVINYEYNHVIGTKGYEKPLYEILYEAYEPVIVKDKHGGLHINEDVLFKNGKIRHANLNLYFLTKEAYDERFKFTDEYKYRYVHHIAVLLKHVHILKLSC